jgi:hypothetical protein
LGSTAGSNNSSGSFTLEKDPSSSDGIISKDFSSKQTINGKVSGSSFSFNFTDTGTSSGGYKYNFNVNVSGSVSGNTLTYTDTETGTFGGSTATVLGRYTATK